MDKKQIVELIRKKHKKAEELYKNSNNKMNYDHNFVLKILNLFQGLKIQI